MSEILKSEVSVLKAFLELPTRKLLNHKFEMEEDCLTGYVQRFLKGERFDIEFKAFSEEELNAINPLISKHIQTDDGKDLLTAFLLTKIACNIMNKYKTSQTE
jgi:hypothetical protein